MAYICRFLNPILLRLTHIRPGKEKADGKSLLKAAGHELETLWVKGQQVTVHHQTSPTTNNTCNGDNLRDFSLP